MAWLILIGTPVAFCALVFALLYVRDKRAAARERRRRLQHRDELLRSRRALSEDEFAKRWGEDAKPDVVLRVLRALARVSDSSFGLLLPEIDEEKLGPDDRLFADLGFDLDSLAYVDLFMRLDDEFGIELKQHDLEATNRPTTTVRDVVRLVTDKLRES